MNSKLLVKITFLLMLLVVGYQSEAQLGRFGVKKPKVKTPVVKKPTAKKTPPKTTTSTSNESTSTTNSSAAKSKETSDAPKYDRDNQDNPIYKNYRKADRFIKLAGEGFESSTVGLSSIEEYLEDANEGMIFLKENGEGNKNYYKNLEQLYSTHSKTLKEKQEKSTVLSEYQSYFERMRSFYKSKDKEEYESKKKEYQAGKYQSKYIDGLIVKIDNERAENARKRAEANQMKLVPDSKISGYETEFHKNNIGKIVFSNETIELKNVDESKLKESFDYGDNIRFRVFMKEPIYNTIAKLINEDGGKQGKNCEPRSRLRYYIDGKLIHEEGYGGSRMYNPAILYFKEGAEVIGYWTSYRGTLFMKDKFAHDEQEQFKSFLLKARKNLTGKHKLKVEILAYDAENREVEARQAIMATGEITIDFSKKPDLRNNPVICMPKSGTNSTALSLLKNHMKNSNYSRISLLSYVENKPARVIKAEIGYKDKEDNKCYKYYVSYKQHFNYKRGVFDGPLDPDYASEKEEIFCDCLK
jgi:hypothetical protein